MGNVCLIPARSGSKRIPKKNIKLLNGKPLIAYAISAALKSKLVDRVIVSTDSEEIAEIAKHYKAEVPFIRPAELAQDDTPTLPVLQHAVTYLEKNEKYKADLIIVLQPTAPLALAEDIDDAITKITQMKTNSCVSTCEISERPEWMYVFNNDELKPFLDKIPQEKRFRRSQTLSKIFRLNGAVCVVRGNTLMKHNKIIDENSLSAIIMPQERSVDIDKLIDFKLAEFLLKEFYGKNNQNRK
ncbi:MAG: acylneuraminate cytidylyltransferase family protein [bacterium]|nr:acylneuraminate cytidylyltransferase family protein [bacterium]